MGCQRFLLVTLNMTASRIVSGFRILLTRVSRRLPSLLPWRPPPVGYIVYNRCYDFKRWDIRRYVA